MILLLGGLSTANVDHHHFSLSFSLSFLTLCSSVAHRMEEGKTKWRNVCEIEINYPLAVYRAECGIGHHCDRCSQCRRATGQIYLHAHSYELIQLGCARPSELANGRYIHLSVVQAIT